MTVTHSRMTHRLLTHAIKCLSVLTPAFDFTIEATAHCRSWQGFGLGMCWLGSLQLQSILLICVLIEFADHSFAEVHEHFKLLCFTSLFIMKQSNRTIVFIRHRHIDTSVDNQITLHCVYFLLEIFRLLLTKYV